MGLYRRKDSQTWWMSFTENGRLFRRSTETTDRKFAEKVYGKFRLKLLRRNGLTLMRQD